MPRKIAIVLTHPIQYYSPFFKKLTCRKSIECKIFYTRPPQSTLYDAGFEKNVSWDIPLLEGYSYEFCMQNKTLASSKSVIRSIENFTPHAIVVFGWNFFTHFAIMFHFKGKVPVYFRGDSTLIDSYGWLKKLTRKIVLKFIYSFVDKAFYVGKQNKKYYEFAGLKESQLIYAPHAIDNDRFSETFELNKLRNIAVQLGITEETTTFLFVGKFERKKNPLLLIEAFRKFSNNEKVKLIIVGSGGLEVELKKFEKLDDRIKILPFQNQRDIPLYYHLCDVFVLPSAGPEETWGLSVNEAMACSKAVIISNMVGCSDDLVINGLNGYIFETGNADMLHEKMRELANKDSSKKMGTASYSIIQNFSFDKVADVFENNFA